MEPLIKRRWCPEYCSQNIVCCKVYLHRFHKKDPMKKKWSCKIACHRHGFPKFHIKPTLLAKTTCFASGLISTNDLRTRSMILISKSFDTSKAFIQCIRGVVVKLNWSLVSTGKKGRKIYSVYMVWTFSVCTSCVQDQGFLFVMLLTQLSKVSSIIQFHLPLMAGIWLWGQLHRRLYVDHSSEPSFASRSCMKDIERLHPVNISAKQHLPYPWWHRSGVSLFEDLKPCVNLQWPIRRKRTAQDDADNGFADTQKVKRSIQAFKLQEPCFFCHTDSSYSLQKCVPI